MSTATLPAPSIETRPGVRNPQDDDDLQPLENGMHLTADEFLERYDRMPHCKKAELIQGVVYMPSPVRLRLHAKPDTLVQFWMNLYVAMVAGAEVYGNGTIRFGPKDVPQPDSMLCLPKSLGGRSSISEEDYLSGAPELVAEVTASSKNYDLFEKLKTYRQFSVPEYLLYLTLDKEVRWLSLENDEYKKLPPDPDGIIRSRVLPGLWLNVEALKSGDRIGLRETLDLGLASPEFKAFLASAAKP